MANFPNHTTVHPATLIKRISLFLGMIGFHRYSVMPADGLQMTRFLRTNLRWRRACRVTFRTVFGAGLPFTTQGGITTLLAAAPVILPAFDQGLGAPSNPLVTLG